MWNRNMYPMPELLELSQVPEELWRDTYLHVVEYQSKISNLLASARKVHFCAYGTGFSFIVVIHWMILVLNVEVFSVILYLFFCWVVPCFLTVFILQHGGRLTQADKSNQVRLLLEWKRYVEQLQRLYRPYRIRVSILLPRRRGSNQQQQQAKFVGALHFSPIILRRSPGRSPQALRLAARLAAFPTTTTTPSSSSLVEELQKLAHLKAEGVLTQQEFVLAKAQLLQQPAPHTARVPDWAVSSTTATSAPAVSVPVDSRTLGHDQDEEIEFAVAQVLPMTNDDDNHHHPDRWHPIVVVPPTATTTTTVATSSSLAVPSPLQVEQGSMDSSDSHEHDEQGVQGDVEKVRFLSNATS